MKKIILHLLTFYRLIISPLLHQLLGIRSLCRYSPSCFWYTRRAIEQQGVVTGGLMSLKRLLHCQPYINNHAII